MIDLDEQRLVRELRKKNLTIAPRSSHSKLVAGLTEFYASKKADHLNDHSTFVNHPHTLFITCADSTVNPAVMTCSHQRELFCIRNIGNFIPPYHAKPAHSETAALEFALTYLDITNIVVCGHSNCSAMKACQYGDDKNIPRTFNHWIGEIRSQLSFHAKTTINQIAQRNILNQIENLKKYPVVQEKLERGNLNLHAWFYDADKQVVDEWDKSTQRFELLGSVPTVQPV